MENLKYKGGLSMAGFIKNFCAGILTYRLSVMRREDNDPISAREGRFYLRWAGVDGITSALSAVWRGGFAVSR